MITIELSIFEKGAVWRTENFLQGEEMIPHSHLVLSVIFLLNDSDSSKLAKKVRTSPAGPVQ